MREGCELEHSINMDDDEIFCIHRMCNTSTHQMWIANSFDELIR
jgi:hypothetical protein